MRILTAFLSLAIAAAIAGCGTNMQQSTQAPAKAEPQAVAEPTGPRASDPPATWTKGKVFRVWPFGNGELMAYLGSKDGIRTGDTLALQRGGVTLNSIEVVEVHEDTFLGRIVMRDDAGAWPKEGDMAVRIPKTR